MEDKYRRCLKCSWVYNTKLNKCPQCGEKQPVNEDFDSSDDVVFNILD